MKHLISSLILCHFDCSHVPLEVFLIVYTRLITILSKYEQLWLSISENGPASVLVAMVILRYILL